MHRMLPHTNRSLTRRAISGVLVLWLCVVAAGAWAPMARAHMAAQGMEQLCSGHGVPQWVSSPVAQAEHGDAAALHHLIDCPLCLPVLAPPPDVHRTIQQAMESPIPVLHADVLHAAVALYLPPARGPPDLSKTRE